MTTDRELLELAAKACGYLTDGVFGKGFLVVVQLGTKYQRSFSFDPLNDDGDALRLAVKLGLSVNIDLCSDETRVSETECELIAKHMHFDGGPEHATRRAIVRAAAEIGRRLE